MASEEHLEHLRDSMAANNGCASWNQWRSEHPNVKIDLICADLRRANLINVDLTRANLTHAVIKDADLTNANLMGADLRNADLTPLKKAA